MAKIKSIKVDFVALHFRDFLPDLLTMTTIESGIYARLCFKIYDEGGWLPDKTQVLASISGLSEEDFTRHFANIERKFIKEKEFISQKRCLFELKKSWKLIQAQRKGGQNRQKQLKNGSFIHSINRQDSLNSPSGVLPTVQGRVDETRPRVEKNNTNTSNSLKESLAKIEKQMLSTNSNSFLNSSSPSDSSREADKLALYQALIQFFDIRNNGDRTCIDNICKWAVNHVLASQWKNDFYKKIIDLAQEAKTNAKRNRWGYFLDALRREFGYVPPSKV